MIRIGSALLVKIRSKILDQNTLAMNDQEVIMNSFKHFSGTEIGPFRIYSDHEYGPYYMVHCKLPYKVGCVFPVAVISILPQAESGPYHHREDAPHFSKILSISLLVVEIQISWLGT